MTKVCGLARFPLFNPIVADFYSGMCVTVPLHVSLMDKVFSPTQLQEFFTEFYRESVFISVADKSEKFLAANAFSGSNRMQIYVDGNSEQILLCSRFDNLGKGASGAAVQNMNIALGLPEDAYLK